MGITVTERQKTEAILRMRLMGVKERHIRDFKEGGKIHLSAEEGTLPELTDKDMEMIRGFERAYDALVYMVIRTDLGFGVMDSMLYVSMRYEEEWPLERVDLKDGYAMTYTVNYRYPECSEFGGIAFTRTDAGEIIRAH